jgi:HEAT repeat protein
LPRPLLLALPLLALLALSGRARLGADASDWQNRLGRADPIEVFEATRLAVERKDHDAALPLIEAALDTPYPHIAIACGEALHELGWPGDDKKAIDEAERVVKKALKDKSDEKQLNLARLLGTWGDPLVDEPLGYLASGRRTPEVQVEALIMSGSLVPTGAHPMPETRDAIEKAFKGRTQEVRVAACSAAARRGDKSHVEGLVALARRDKDDYPGLYAVWALRRLDYADGISTFVHVLGQNPKKTTRQACLKAVTDLSALGDVEELLALTKNSKKDYRDAAALALKRMAWKGKFPARTVTGEKAQKPVLEVPDKVIERLVTMVEEESEWEVRDAARQALLGIGEAAGPLIRERMPRGVDFSDEDARLTAMELAGLYGAEEAYKSLQKAAIFDKSRTVRMFAARALEGVSPREAVKDLLQVASGAGKKPRDYEGYAVRALGYIRHRDAFDALLGLLESRLGGGEGDELMWEIEFALERLTGHRFGRKPERWKAWIEKAKNPLHPRVQKYNRVENRREVIEKGLYGLSRETERAVENGLRWLELQQHSIGFWDGNEKGFGGVVNCEPAYTGLSLLAFLGAGYNGARGKYRETIRRAVEFLAATQFYDGGYPVTGGTDNSWIFAYLIAMGVWGVTEGYALAGDEALREPAQWGIDYLVRVQTPGAGWRYGPRYVQSDTSCTSWTLMTMKAADLIGLEVAQKSFDGIDSWLERCSYDITGEEEIPEDLSTDYDYEVGSRRYFKAFTGYFELSGAEKSALQQTSMTAVGMVCRFFMGWKRSHPFLIGSANYLLDYLPQWMKGLEKGQAIAWYHYFWYYGTLAMYQMGGRYWRAWNEKIKRMYPENQRTSPPELIGSWDPDTALLNGGRLFSTAMSILSLETYYRFSPLLGEAEEPDGKADAPK